jgi:hypothetical protein
LVQFDAISAHAKRNGRALTKRRQARILKRLYRRNRRSSPAQLERRNRAAQQARWAAWERLAAQEATVARLRALAVLAAVRARLQQILAVRVARLRRRRLRYALERAGRSSGRKKRHRSGSGDPDSPADVAGQPARLAATERVP